MVFAMHVVLQSTAHFQTNVSKGQCLVSKPQEHTFIMIECAGSISPLLRRRAVFVIGRSGCIEAMWKVVMSEEVAKAVQSVVDRVNQAAARRPKVSPAEIARVKAIVALCN